MLNIENEFFLSYFSPFNYSITPYIDEKIKFKKFENIKINISNQDKYINLLKIFKGESI